MPTHCGEESMSDFSTKIFVCTSWHQEAFSTPCRMINGGSFRYKFKVDDTLDVKKADQFCFDLGL
jgi:hypothetical protein